jgi:CelD/BcsL family acetyltransferase involved in cellulose biosynthesis
LKGLTRLNSYRETEEQWTALLATSTVDTLFCTPQWQGTWWEQFGGDSEMLLLCLKGDEGITGIAPLSRRNGTISFIGSRDVSDYSDFLVSRGAERCFYSSLVDHLDGEQWEQLELSSLPTHSPTLVYLPELARGRGYHVDVVEEDVAPGIALPDDWERYLQSLSKKDRHELRRKFRRLDSSGEEVKLVKYSSPAEAVTDLDDFFTLMRQSKEAKHRFLTPDRERFFRKVAGVLANMNVFRLFFLEMGEKRVAAAMCFDYGGARLLYNSGYDPSYGYYSVGLLLKALCLKDAIEQGKAYFDFLRGPEPYKYDLGAKNTALYQMVVTRS